jgi:hypothetical protein
MVESIPSIRSSRFRRREFVQEEVRKTMINYMTSIKGEITDIVIDEMIDYYNTQTLKLYHLEKELIDIKNSSLPMINNNNNTLLNNLIIHMTKQEHLFELMENKIKNLTNILNELQQKKSIQHVRRFVEINNNKIPIGKLKGDSKVSTLFRKSILSMINIYVGN